MFKGKLLGKLNVGPYQFNIGATFARRLNQILLNYLKKKVPILQKKKISWHEKRRSLRPTTFFLCVAFSMRLVTKFKGKQFLECIVSMETLAL